MTASLLRKISDTFRPHTRRYAFGLAIAVGAMLAAPPSAHAILTNGNNAIDVLGQFGVSGLDTTPDYTKGCIDDGASQIGFGFSLAAFSNPGVIIDSTNHRLFVSDSGNNRVLVYTLTGGNLISSKTPANVLGQPDFISCGAATTQSGMNTPSGMDFDATNNRLFVADQNNNRVLVFNTSSITNGMNASYVLGQADFVTPTAATTQSGMSQPYDVKYDSTNSRAFVADQVNNRVLVFDALPADIANGENASFELGQPSGGTAFTTATPATSQSGMSAPTGLAYASNRIYVADQNNNRVLYFNVTPGTLANGENASNEQGQPSGGTAFTTATCATSQSGLCGPSDLAYDSAHTLLYVAEYKNNRVMTFNAASLGNGIAATHVLGQADFTHGNAATTQSGMNTPDGIAYDSTNSQLYVADQNNNRVMLFSTSSITNGENASDLLGQYTSLTSASTVTYTQSAANDGLTQLGLDEPADAAIDAVHHRLFVADAANNRVLVYTLSADNSFPTGSGGHTPSYVLGQADFVSVGDDNSIGVVGQAGMDEPDGLAYDAGNDRLFVSDTGNDRVLVFSTSTITNGMNASYVLGEPDFVTTGGGFTKSTMNLPVGLAYDAANSRLFEVDASANRVMVWNVAPGTIANGENASNELGQGGTAITQWTQHGTAHTASAFNAPQAVAYDATNSRLFVSDGTNNRVMVFNVAPGTLVNDEAAVNALGCASLTTVCGGGLTQAGMLYPKNMSYDPNTNRLFVADQGHERVLVFNVGPSVITKGENASFVLGEPDFTTNSGNNNGPNNLSQSGLGLDYSNNQMDCALYDPSTTHLFVCDTYYKRVMIFDGSFLPTGDYFNP
jgi:DNA-binding beta-propeller fold protein YncE